MRRSNDWLIFDLMAVPGLAPRRVHSSATSLGKVGPSQSGWQRKKRSSELRNWMCEQVILQEQEQHPPERQVRAYFSERIVRVYQAYSSEIADRALIAQTFVAPFKRSRMTWVKPSFTWMMYRSGWASKSGQERILAIDILRSGFERALSRSCLAEYDGTIYRSREAWRASLVESPVRVQWDPERSLTLEPLQWR